MTIRLKEVMKEKGVTGRELATRLNTTPQYISNITSGRQNLSLNGIDEVAKALGVEPWELLVSREQLANYKSDSLMTQCPHCGKPITIKATIE
ncbi:helix-turn-helix transcriptional regulator [Muribaculum sp.]|uniref:helix-turn-helix domain-containing protein n=1 Tax=Muribaculum sp. TaxID=1918611 RepID=UPI00258F6ECC|nr:helix-turn-helix transcriptional regulator [Muribaculum sp.]MCX4279333.1 helix-turn-helix transcriptional regulator [Muribaculum sp.]